MANLYQIDEKLINAIEYGCDTETGEFLDENAINELYMALNDKIEGVALYQKNLDSDIKALDEEIKNLQARKKSKQNRKNSLENYLSNYLISKDINKFETPKVLIKFRKSSSVDIFDQSIIPKEFINITTEEKVDKKAIKEWYKTHPDELMNGARIVETQNMQIK